MAVDTSQGSFRRGVMSLVILTLLKREDMYGYQLVQETSRSGRCMIFLPSFCIFISSLV